MQLPFSALHGPGEQAAVVSGSSLVSRCWANRFRASVATSGSWRATYSATASDEEILARALAEGRVLVTLDKDFGELAIVRELPHAGILRLVAQSALQQAEVTLRVIEAHGADLAAGAIITAEAGRLRVRLHSAGG